MEINAEVLFCPDSWRAPPLRTPAGAARGSDSCRCCAALFSFQAVLRRLLLTTRQQQLHKQRDDVLNLLIDGEAMQMGAGERPQGTRQAHQYAVEGTEHFTSAVVTSAPSSLPRDCAAAPENTKLATFNASAQVFVPSGHREVPKPAPADHGCTAPAEEAPAEEAPAEEATASYRDALETITSGNQVIKNVYKCVRAFMVTADVNFAIVAEAECVRLLALSEVLEMEGSAKKDCTGVERVRCKAVSDGTVGWVSVVGNGCYFSETLCHFARAPGGRFGKRSFARPWTPRRSR